VSNRKICLWFLMILSQKENKDKKKNEEIQRENAPEGKSLRKRGSVATLRILVFCLQRRRKKADLPTS